VSRLVGSEMCIRDRLNAAGMGSLVGFLLEDCCGGRPELCGPAGLIQLTTPAVKGAGNKKGTQAK
jgi:hypothetical protein